MWETRIKYAINLSREKRKMVGEDNNGYRNKRRKTNGKRKMNEQIVSPPKYKGTKIDSFEVCTKHLVIASGTYKPKQWTSSTLKANALATKETNGTYFSAYMEHSVKASATYKPKQCIGSAKRRIKKTIMNEMKTNQTSKSTCMKHQQKRIAIDKTHLCEQLIKGNKRSKILPSTKQKFKKSFPPITKLIDGDRSKKKIQVGGKKNNDVNEKLKSLKRKAEADTSQLRKYEKRRNHDFIQSQAGRQLECRES